MNYQSTQNIENNMKQVYQFGISYLQSMMDSHPILKNVKMDEYFSSDSNTQSMQNVTKSLFRTLNNRNMMKSVVNYESKEDVVEKMLFYYDPKKIYDYWDNESLFKEFQKHFTINNADSPLNLWRQFAKGIISASSYLCDFEAIDDLVEYFDSFQDEIVSKEKLPMILSRKIHGLGFALACDFLKEIGYDYAKPDVHIKEIFSELGFCSKDDLDVFRSVIRMAKVNETKVYIVDKIFWLISSGYFYKHNIRIPGRRQELIEQAQLVLHL